MLHHLYIADDATGVSDPSAWDTNRTTEQVIERIDEAVRANQPDEELTIFVRTFNEREG